MGKLSSYVNKHLSNKKKASPNTEVTRLSFEESSNIDQKLAEGLREIKRDFKVKERNSRAFVQKIELRSHNR